MESSSHAAGIVRHLDHFVLPVVDPDRAERFYAGVLGGRVLKKMTDPSVTRIFIKLGQNHVGLFSQNKATIPQPEFLDSFPRHGFLAPASEFERIAARIGGASPLVKKIKKRG